MSYKLCPICGSKLQVINGCYVCTNSDCTLLIIGNSILDAKDIYSLMKSDESDNNQANESQENKIEVLVMNKQAVEDYGIQLHNKKSVIISIASKQTNSAFIVANTPSNIQDILKVEFNDTDREDEYSGCITYTDVKVIADFVRKYTKHGSIERIIVQCEAGQSRSAGIAAAILKYLYDDDTQIFDNKRYTPNMLCYRKVLTALMYEQ